MNTRWYTRVKRFVKGFLPFSFLFMTFNGKFEFKKLAAMHHIILLPNNNNNIILYLTLHHQRHLQNYMRDAKQWTIS